MVWLHNNRATPLCERVISGSNILGFLFNLGSLGREMWVMLLYHVLDVVEKFVHSLHTPGWLIVVGGFGASLGNGGLT